MAEITVTNRNQASGLGNLPVVVGNSASIANGDTWNTKLASVNQVFIGGLGASQSFTWSASGGTITFTVVSGPITSASLMAIGGNA